jgi:hypothetical protein
MASSPCDNVLAYWRWWNNYAFEKHTLQGSVTIIQKDGV